MEDKSISVRGLGFGDFSPFDLLDKVLRILTVESAGGRTIRGALSRKIIYQELEHNHRISLHNEEFNSIISKLVSDNYIKELTLEAGTIEAYSLTFDGFVFYSKGGYKSQNDDAESQRLQVRNSYYLTLVIAVGTAIAAIYYVKEIFHIGN